MLAYRSIKTLPEALFAVAERGVGEYVVHLDDGPVRASSAELAERARRGAAALAARGIEPGDTVGVLGPNRLEWVIWAFATWTAGATLVPLQLPLRLRDPSAFRDQLRSLIEASGCRIVVAAPELVGLVPAGLALPWTEIPPSGDYEARLEGHETAVIQLTSGSTAKPRGAAISHAAILAQMRAIHDLVGRDPGELTPLMWTPFFHDLGLVVSLVCPTVFGATVHLLPTERFARAPGEWLRLVGETRAKLTIAPCSAWEVAVRFALRGSDPIDLSSLDYACFAAEGIDPDAVDQIVSNSDRLGLNPAVLGATYGLAEAVLSVTATRPGEGMRFDRIDPAAMAVSGLARPAGEGRGRRMVCSGRPVLGAEIKIVREGGEVPERDVGEIHVRGESMMQGYVGSSEWQPFEDGWLVTGDMGYLADGELYVTGRVKDMLIVMGHNYYPDDFEWAAARVQGVRSGRCVAFVPDGRERIVLLIESGGQRDGAELSLAVKNAVSDAVGVAPGEVLVVPRGTIDTTTSGKLRRSAMRDAYNRGELGG